MMMICKVKSNNNNIKSAQSNLGRASCRGTVAHVRCKVSSPPIRPKSTPSRGPIRKPHYLPHSWTRPTYDPKRHPDPIRRLFTMHWTDRPTHQRGESLMTICRCATRATRPNNNNLHT